MAAARVHATRAVITGGIALVGAGSAAAAAGLTAAGGRASLVAWGVVAGFGLGAASVAATTLGTSAVRDADRGMVAGLLSTAAQVGTAVGVAALVLVAGTAPPATGHRLGFAAAAGLAVLGVLVLALLLRAPSVSRGPAPARR